MRIAFDVSPLSHERTGVNNYIRGSLAGLAEAARPRGHEIVAFAPGHAHEVGALLGASRTTDVVDAHVAILASKRDAMVITSDDDDLRRLSVCLPSPVRVEHV